MATSKDYIGKRFGEFLIEARIGGGAEAEVLQCLHSATGLRYVLRLSVDDDSLWSGEPLIPPQNASMESNNARGTWLVAPSYYQASLTKTASDWKMKTPAIYGVFQNRYLIPVASPIRVKAVKDIDEVLTLAPADDLWLFGLWEAILGALIFEAYANVDMEGGSTLSELPLIVGGPILADSAKRFMANGTLSIDEQTAILAALAPPIDTPELAENLLLRICGCVERGRLTTEEVRALFRCRHLRINVTIHDVQQMMQVHQLLSQQTPQDDDSLGLLGGVLNLLTSPPADPFVEPGLFEIRTERPDPGRFTLFLQEHASVDQPVLTLEAN
jgi:hypothetical protein